jgi:predicted Rdx family selenoprotein
MEPSATPGAQTGVPSGSGEPSHVPPDYEDEFLRYLWRDYLYPKQYEWVLIAAYVAVFLIALVGNTLGRCGFCSVVLWASPGGVLGLTCCPPSSWQGRMGGGGMALPLNSPRLCLQSAWPCGGTTI